LIWATRPPNLEYINVIDIASDDDLRVKARTAFPKWEFLKNKSGKSGMFSSLKNDRQLTSFHQQSTTNSPSKNHVLHCVFSKTPSKNEVKPASEKNYRKSVHFGPQIR
jgi:hypothetical protein